MFVQAVAFYVFAAVAVASAIMVISARNPVHSVLFLILAFFNGAGLFILMGAEFLAMILVVVYVGAVAVMFLFVVMMLDVNFAELRQGFMRYLPLGAGVGLILLAELIFVLSSPAFVADVSEAAITTMPATVSNTHALGGIIYTKYVLFFQISGLILLIAMVGAIVLTHRRRTGVRRQNVSTQVNRRPSDSIELRRIPRERIGQ